jgi:hypothetical protein
MRASKDDPQFRLRLPADLKAWIEARANANYHSINLEVVLLLSAAKERHDRAKAARLPRQAAP